MLPDKINEVINSLGPSDINKRWQPTTSLVQIMACRLFGAKQLSEPVRECWIHILVKFL